MDNPFLEGGISSSSREKRHDGKDPEHHVVDRPRNGVSACQVLSNRHIATSVHDREFREKQQAERDEAHAKPAGRC